MVHYTYICYFDIDVQKNKELCENPLLLHVIVRVTETNVSWTFYVEVMNSSVMHTWMSLIEHYL
jgi:hypothetical protein